MFRRKLIKFLLVVIASLLYHGTSVKLRDILSLRGLRRSENVNALVRSGIQVVSTCPLFYNQSTYGTLKLVDNNQDIEVKYYLPSVFQKLRKLAGFEEDEYHNILSASKFNEIVADSKSRQAFLKSDDDRLLVKTISHRECKLLCSIAVSLTQYIEQAKCTCLNNILGLYEILCRGDVVYVLISKNIFYSPVISNSSSPNLFDIKGSLVGRCKSNISKVWKDLDLIRSPFVLDTLQSPVLLDALQKDVNFLSKHGLMDYSLLICKSCRTGHEPFISCKGPLMLPNIDGTTMIQCGIVDFLQQYTLRKRMETLLKSLFHETISISCVDPITYGRRLVSFIRMHICPQTGDFATSN